MNIQKMALKTTRADGMPVDLVMSTGIAIFDYKGSGGSWKRDRLMMRIPTTWNLSPRLSPIDFTPQAVVSVSLGSISNSNEAIQAGWATDSSAISIERGDDGYGRVIIAVDLAVRDSDGFIHRVIWDLKTMGWLHQL